MENYNFKYKPIKIKISRKLNSLFSDIVFYLYRNRTFKKLKLDRNILIKHTVDSSEKRTIFKHNKELPNKILIDPYSVTFFDLIDFDDFLANKQKFIKFLSKYKAGFLSKHPEIEFNRTFEKLQNTYKTISIGNIYFNDLKDNTELDLIDGISYSYVKGQQAFILLIYTVFPSQKFIDYFKNYLNKPIVEKKEIIFNSFRNILKGKKWIITVNHKPVYPIYYIDKLYNELNFQFKSIVMSDYKFGIFNSNKNSLFPFAVTYEYDKIKTKSYFNEVLDRLRIIDRELYSNNLIKIHFPDNPTSQGKLILLYLTPLLNHYGLKVHRLGKD